MHAGRMPAESDKGRSRGSARRPSLLHAEVVEVAAVSHHAIERYERRRRTRPLVRSCARCNSVVIGFFPLSQITNYANIGLDRSSFILAPFTTSPSPTLSDMKVTWPMAPST